MGDLADGSRPFGGDVHEDGDLAAAEPDVELEPWPAVPPEPAHHRAQQSSQLVQLLVACHMVKVTR